MWSKKQFMQLTNCTAAALIYYEKLGLINPKREVNHYRIYTEVEHETIKLIKVLQYAQFSLEEIKKLVILANQKKSKECEDDTQKIFIKKKNELLLMIQEYKKITDYINQYIEPKAFYANDKLDDRTMTFIDEVYQNIRNEVSDAN